MHQTIIIPVSVHLLQHLPLLPFLLLELFLFSDSLGELEFFLLLELGIVVGLVWMLLVVTCDPLLQKLEEDLLELLNLVTSLIPLLDGFLAFLLPLLVVLSDLGILD